MKRLEQFIASLTGKKKPPEWIRRLLHTTAHARHYPLVVACIAFVLTLTFAFPFGCVLVLAVLLAPRRWLLIGALSGLASGLGGALLVTIFRMWGDEFILSQYPQLLADPRWQFLHPWLNAYGLWALAVIAASPLPQTPFVLLYALHEPSIVGAFIAIGIGKCIKYLFIAWITAYFPGRFVEAYCDP